MRKLLCLPIFSFLVLVANEPEAAAATPPLEVTFGATYSLAEDVGQKYGFGGYALGVRYGWQLGKQFLLQVEAELQSWQVESRTVNGFELDIGSYQYLALGPRLYWLWQKNWSSGFAPSARYLFDDPVGANKLYSYHLGLVPVRFSAKKFFSEIEINFLQDFSNTEALPLVWRVGYAF